MTCNFTRCSLIGGNETLLSLFASELLLDEGTWIVLILSLWIVSFFWLFLRLYFQKCASLALSVDVCEANRGFEEWVGVFSDLLLLFIFWPDDSAWESLDLPKCASPPICAFLELIFISAIELSGVKFTLKSEVAERPSFFKKSYL